jgi:hypothetical protein
MPESIAEIAQRHGFSPDAARAVAEALRRGNFTTAQFNHPELGGMGQWVAGGMLMIGDMFNNDLKARVGALCRDLAAAPGPVPAAAEQQPSQPSNWWSGDLGHPSATGAQNDMRTPASPTAGASPSCRTAECASSTPASIASAAFPSSRAPTST